MQVPDELLLAIELLTPVDVVLDVVVLDATELELLLLLDDPPPQLIRPVAPIKPNIPSVPKVRRRSLSIGSICVVVGEFLLGSLGIVFSLHGDW